ncbi:ferritin family protein [Halobacillus sp. HZG1]|uniref:ferritin family protein n=1 Tax=Halobacillus sp. HZG1 TaxID=3111769 RepID=UPI002DBD9A32|nr:ferritin family protein [Halobacillus sp. HZG1]MEC3885312.1 ferritin family protein [Halobacillus sp. HZG1]
MYRNQYGYTFNSYGYDGYFRVQSDQSIVKDIEKAINGEYSAIACYNKLADLAPTQQARQQIYEIRQDEIRHYEAFTSIYKQLTGKQPSPKIDAPCSEQYREGIDAAFIDEQKTTDFYHEIERKAQDLSIKETFRQAAADEQNHAVWFLYFLSHPKKDRAQIRQQDYGATGALNASSLTFQDMLTYAIQDEYLAQARYDAIRREFGDIQTFVRIQEAEKRHITALNTLFTRYQFPIPSDNASQYVITPDSVKAAYAAGVEGEIENISMYEKFLLYELPEDVRTVFTQLRNASLNHLAAFRRGLARFEDS